MTGRGKSKDDQGGTGTLAAGLPGGAAEAVLDAIPDAVCAIDGMERVIYFNLAAERMLGLRRSEVVGRCLSEVCPGLAGSDLHRSVQRGLVDRVPYRAEADSSVFGFPAELDIVPMAWGVALHIRDASRHRQMETALRDRDDLLTLAEHSAGVGIWEIDLGSDTVRGTPQYFRIMGLEAERPAGADGSDSRPTSSRRS